MRAFVLSLIVLLALAGGQADAEPQSFFDGLRNIFGGRPAPRPARPPPQRRPPPQQFQQQQQQQQPGVPIQPAQPVQPTQQQFRQPPPQQPQQFRQPQQQQQFARPQQQQQFARPQPQQQQQQFGRPAAAPQETFRRPAQNVGRPAARPQQQQVITNNPAPVVTIAAPACNPDNFQGLKDCPGACPNEFDKNGNAFILTYKIDEKKCSNFTQSEADQYCRQQGGRPVSLDDNVRAQYFINLAIRDRKRYFWTGGKIDHNIGTVTWPSGKQEGIGTRGERFWSHTGGKKPVAEPQPDNRDGDEVCLAVLNNFYADGVKWHDVGCHHRKPTICEFDKSA